MVHIDNALCLHIHDVSRLQVLHHHFSSSLLLYLIFYLLYHEIIIVINIIFIFIISFFNIMVRIVVPLYLSILSIDEYELFLNSIIRVTLIIVMIIMVL